MHAMERPGRPRAQGLALDVLVEHALVLMRNTLGVTQLSSVLLRLGPRSLSDHFKHHFYLIGSVRKADGLH